MKLTIEERINLLSVLPRQGTRITGRAILDFLRDLEFSEVELTQYEISQVPGNYPIWNKAKLPKDGFEIDITKWRKEFIIETFEELEKIGKNGSLPVSLIPLWDRLEDEIENTTTMSSDAEKTLRINK